jgi:predicted nucleic acid-binding protein
MIVVSDTGPIISLAVLGKLDLFEVLYDKVIIPEKVWLELVQKIEEFSIPEVERFKDKVVAVSGGRTIEARIEAGEKEAILLYEQTGADRLLVEDRNAKRCAPERGIHCIGTLTVLSEAKDRGLIPALRPLFAVLLERKRFFSKALLDGVLAVSGELPLY